MPSAPAGESGEAPPVAEKASRFRGSTPVGGREAAGNRLVRRCSSGEAPPAAEKASRFPPCFWWGSKGEVSLRQRYLPLALAWECPLWDQRESPPWLLSGTPGLLFILPLFQPARNSWGFTALPSRLTAKCRWGVSASAAAVVPTVPMTAPAFTLSPAVTSGFSARLA